MLRFMKRVFDILIVGLCYIMEFLGSLIEILIEETSVAVENSLGRSALWHFRGNLHCFLANSKSKPAWVRHLNLEHGMLGGPVSLSGMLYHHPPVHELASYVSYRDVHQFSSALVTR